MHQVSTARRVAEAIERHPEPWSRVRVSLRSDDGSLPATADAIAAHLLSILPGFDARRLDVVLAALPRWCSRCGEASIQRGDDTPCPACGGPLLPPRGPDPVAIEFVA
jgi:DNA-directed RNA polymerase subunit RPC12/RpoP